MLLQSFSFFHIIRTKLNEMPLKKRTKKNISEIQQDILQEFSCLEGDRESIINYVIELGEALPPMNPLKKTEHNIIPGCMSKTWISYEYGAGIIKFEGDSEASFTKGLLALLIRIFSRQRLGEIIEANLFFISGLGLSNLIGQQRALGLANMVRHIKTVSAVERNRKRRGRKRKDL